MHKGGREDRDDGGETGDVVFHLHLDLNLRQNLCTSSPTNQVSTHPASYVLSISLLMA